MGLRFEHGELLRLGLETHIDPRGELINLEVRIAAEDELADDLLHPGGPGLGVRRDDDVVVPIAEVVPDRRIGEARPKLPGFPRPGQGSAPDACLARTTPSRAWPRAMAGRRLARRAFPVLVGCRWRRSRLRPTYVPPHRVDRLTLVYQTFDRANHRAIGEEEVVGAAGLEDELADGDATPRAKVERRDNISATEELE